MICAAPGPSCSSSSCRYSAHEVREAEHFWKRHRPKHNFSGLFAPPLGRGSHGYTEWDRDFNFSLVPLLASNAPWLASMQAVAERIDQLLHAPTHEGAQACSEASGSSICRLGHPAGHDGGWPLCMPPKMRSAHPTHAQPRPSAAGAGAGAGGRSSGGGGSGESDCVVLSFGIRDDPYSCWSSNPGLVLLRLVPLLTTRRLPLAYGQLVRCGGRTSVCALWEPNLCTRAARARASFLALLTQRSALLSAPDALA